MMMTMMIMINTLIIKELIEIIYADNNDRTTTYVDVNLKKKKRHCKKKNKVE